MGSQIRLPPSKSPVGTRYVNSRPSRTQGPPSPFPPPFPQGKGTRGATKDSPILPPRKTDQDPRKQFPRPVYPRVMCRGPNPPPGPLRTTSHRPTPPTTTFTPGESKTRTMVLNHPSRSIDPLRDIPSPPPSTDARPRPHLTLLHRVSRPLPPLNVRYLSDNNPDTRSPWRGKNISKNLNLAAKTLV